MNGVQGAGGSNPLVPTSKIKGLDAHLKRLTLFLSFLVFSIVTAGLIF